MKNKYAFPEALRTAWDKDSLSYILLELRDIARIKAAILRAQTTEEMEEMERLDRAAYTLDVVARGIGV